MISLAHSYNFRRKKESRLAREYREWDLDEIASAYTLLVRISFSRTLLSLSKRVVSLLALFMWDSYMLELEKKRCYEERIREIEHGSFTPLVLSAAGGIGPAATIVYKRLASLISEKQGRPYSHWVVSNTRLNLKAWGWGEYSRLAIGEIQTKFLTAKISCNAEFVATFVFITSKLIYYWDNYAENKISLEVIKVNRM